jgi:hypothetical protein
LTRQQQPVRIAVEQKSWHCHICRHDDAIERTAAAAGSGNTSKRRRGARSIAKEAAA